LSTIIGFSDIVLILLWLFALFAISPFGEFPINDDWAYAKNVQHLAVGGRFILDTFPAMNLLSQTLYCIAIIEVRDFFSWQETRWKALNELNERGISSAQIDGGFEYNGWYKPTENWSEKGKSWWWVKDDEFVVSTQRLKKYEVEKVYSFTRLMPYGTDSIYVLKRELRY
jgi:hypothetical protein